MSEYIYIGRDIKVVCLICGVAVPPRIIRYDINYVYTNNVGRQNLRKLKRLLVEYHLELYIYSYIQCRS